MFGFHPTATYLQGVKHTFNYGSGRVDLLEVLSTIVLYAGPFILLLTILKFRKVIFFFLGRMIAKAFYSKDRFVVENYLASKNVLLDVRMVLPGNEEKRLAMARVDTVSDGTINLKLAKVQPTPLNVDRARIICLFKGLVLEGERINSFSTYVRHVTKRGTVVKKLSLYTPARYKYTIQRKHERRAINPAAVRVKIWDPAKRNSFWLSKPKLWTISKATKDRSKVSWLRVADLSPGGIRLFVENRRGNLPSLAKGAQLILRVSVRNPETGKFMYVNVIGVIRARFKGKSGGLGLGIQFVAIGEQLGETRIRWKKLAGEVPALQDFMNKYQDQL